MEIYELHDSGCNFYPAGHLLFKRHRENVQKLSKLVQRSCIAVYITTHIVLLLFKHIGYLVRNIVFIMAHSLVSVFL